MDTWAYYGITHADHLFCNPLGSERVDELIGLLDLPVGARVVEVACGKGEFLARLAERYRVTGVGVDMSPWEAPVARARIAARVPAASLRIVQADAASYPFEPASADLAVCLGASWIWDGHGGTLAALARIARPGGLVLVGEPYWRRAPDPEYVAATDLEGVEVGTHAGNVAAGAEQGLTFLYAMPSREDEWDRYEMLQVRAAERYAAAHPADPDVAELLERARRGCDAYLRWGRATLGWSVYLFRTPVG
ncbi:MAG: class I SAM-dependent methyltransferase [Chloroflexi bacterium]|jgi:SAM-dependent methyltransferase|nr:class I SAM-dependent methyltransferase [Chloroflexota bacterium]